MAHALLSAVEFQVTGKDPLTGAMAGVTGEATAQYLTKALYNKAPSELTVSEKETISSLSQLAGGLAGAFTAKTNGSIDNQGGNVLCESGHLYQMNAGAEEVERNLGFFSRMTVPYPNNLNENNRILLSTLVEQENANSFNQLSSGTKIGLSAIELGAAIGGTGLITKDSLGKFKLSNANANSKLPVVGKTENYENQTSKIHISSGTENNALPPNLKYQQEATRYINNSVNGFYDSKEYRELLTRKYGENVKSTTVPPSNAKNVNLASKRHPITGVPFDNKGFPIFDKYVAYDTRLDISSFRNKSYIEQMSMATRDLANSIEKGYINKNNFTSEQLNAIYRGEKKIPGFTWHHHQDTGRMQLIDSDIHKKTGHIGWRGLKNEK